MAVTTDDYEQRRKKIENVLPRVELTFGVDPFASIHAAIAKSKNAINAATSRGKFLPDTPRQDFDDRPNRDQVSSSSVALAHELLACHIRGEDGSCKHGKVDHIDMARQCLENFSRDEAGRAARRKDAGQRVASVRFA